MPNENDMLLLQQRAHTAIQFQEPEQQQVIRQQEQQEENGGVEPAQPKQLQKEASAPAMKEHAQQQGMSRKEQRAAQRRENRAKAQREKEKARQEEEGKKRQQQACTAARLTVDNTMAEIKAKMRKNLSRTQKQENPALEEESARLRLQYEASAPTAPLAPEIDAIQMMVLRYVPHAEDALPMIEQLCKLSEKATEADLLRQETFFRDSFLQEYLGNKGLSVTPLMRRYIDRCTSRASDQIDKTQQSIFGVLKKVLAYVPKEEIESADHMHGQYLKTGRFQYAEEIRRLQKGSGPKKEATAKMAYAKRHYQNREAGAQ